MTAYDVVIVGAGPAGLLAARQAGRAGLKTVLLERKTDITHLDRMCGQTLVSANDYYFNDLVHYHKKGKRIAFLNNGFSFHYDGPIRNCMAWQIFSPCGNCLPFGLPEETAQKGDSGAVGLAYDKEILLSCLLKEVKDVRVEVCEGVDVTSVAQKADSVTVSGNGQSFTGSYLIAADGTNSRIARLAGFNTDRTFYCYLLSQGFRMQGLKLPSDEMLISSICFDTIAPGYMFVFPRAYEGEAHVAFLTLDPRVDLSQVSGYFMKQNPYYAEWFKDSRILARSGSAQYVYSPVPVPYSNRVLLAGDTGSCQELENTGAMISGWKAGNAIAAAVQEDNIGIAARGISDYVKWWQDVYVNGYRHEDYIMNFALPYVIDQGADFDYLCSLAKEPLPPCWNPYAAISHLGQFMQGVMPQIQQERPELLPKLAKMSRPMDEIISETTRACEPIDEFE